MAITKTVIRVLVIGGLATGTAVLVAGPDRVAALAGQAREKVVSAIDSQIDDPVVLRQQLRELEAQYPKKIADVRGSLAELDAQADQIRDELAVAERVVELASADRQEIAPLIEEAELARAESPHAIIRVRFDNQSLPLDQAYTKATELNNTITAYQTRAENARRTLDHLTVQRERLTELLAKLESERAEFQAQISLLDSEIEMIARNEKALEILESHEKKIDQMDRYTVGSLDQVRARMAKALSEQEARFENLARADDANDYESRAKAMLNSEAAARDIFERSKNAAPVLPEKIEIGEPAGKGSDGQVAMNESIVIE